MPNFVRQLVLLCFAWAIVGAQAASGQEPIWHYSPYQVRVWVAPAPAPELNSRLEQEIIRTLGERAEAAAFATWSLTAEPPPAEFRGSMLAGLEWIAVEQLAPPPKKEEKKSRAKAAAPAGAEAKKDAATSSDAGSAPPPLPAAAPPDAPAPAGEASPAAGPPDYTDLLQKTDKLILLSVAPERGGFSIQARELDCRTRQWSDIASRRAGLAELIPLEAFRAVREAFRPLARVEYVKGTQVEVRFRSGGLIENPDSPCYLPVDSILTPIIRLNDRRGLPRENGIQPAAWSFLVTEDSPSGARVHCELTTAAPSALSSRPNSRMEKYGLATRPRFETTDVVLYARPQSRDEERSPLAGYEVHERVSGVEDLKFVARTDWRGLVEIGKSDQPLRVLYVKHGTRTLSKFPVVPGLSQRVEVNVPNDDRRLEVEGFVTGMQGKIMDLVIAREVLALRIRNRIKEGKVADANAFLKELRALPSRDQLQADLDQEAARQRSLPVDKGNKAQIDKLISDTRDLIGKYLDPGLVQTLEKEIGQAQPSG